MKKIIVVLLLVIMAPFVTGADYEFTEAELTVFVGGIVDDVTAEKDSEIAGIINEYDLTIVDKNLEIDTLKVSEESLQKEVKVLETKNATQGIFIKWAPTVIVTTFVAGFITGVMVVSN